MEKQILQSIQHALAVGEGFVRFELVGGAKSAPARGFLAAFGCPEHGIAMGELLPFYFSFNDPDSFCQTCLGLAVYRSVDPQYLVPDPSRSIRAGAFIPEAFKYDKNNWAGRMMYSLSRHYDFSLDTPFEHLSRGIADILFWGSKGERFPLVLPPGATAGDNHVGKLFRFDGIASDIERRYRYYRKNKMADGWMEEYLRRVMVENVCPDCHGTRLKPQRLLVEVGGQDIYTIGEWPLENVYEFLSDLEIEHTAGKQVQNEIVQRIELLLAIGLDYLNLNRKSGTLSGGESQRIRLSTQISSGLMGMMYVLDEPSIGLHAKDNIKLIRTLKRLRDIGNTVIVVEHDEETIRAADYIVEMGPGPGVHGGEVVAEGPIEAVLATPGSLTGQYLSGAKKIAAPAERRPLGQKWLTVHGARQNNLRSIDVGFPIGALTCVTGASGSGKSTLINDILYMRLYARFQDSRVRFGDHDRISGTEHLSGVINIDQSALGRSPRSNSATYVGIYDEIRHLFACQPLSRDRGYTAGRFSFNLRGGRCEACQGDGTLTTHLHFMPDVETTCPSCKGTRYNEETLEVQYRGKSIADVLNLSIEEAVEFFGDFRSARHKLEILNRLGLGYVTLGQSATTLSGGEAQRVKLGYELGKIKRGGGTLYILDEPTTGLHLADIERLLTSLNALVDAGNTVIVIEHHLDVIKCADYIVDLGPEGGRNGGLVIGTGTPEKIAENPRSHTGHFLKPLLGKAMTVMFA